VPERQRLLEGNLGAGLFELLLEGGGLILGDALLDGLRRGLDEILGLLEAESGDLTPILLSPAASRTTVNSVCSTAAAAAGAAAAGAAATAAAADTPHFSSSSFTRAARSMTLRLERYSTTDSRVAMGWFHWLCRHDDGES
jgi:hypothetical protein